MGGVGFWFLGIQPMLQIIDAQGWQEVDCVILSSRVASSDSSDSDTYRIAITYEYEVGDARYEGDRYNFSIGSSSGYDRKAAVVARYPSGTETTCRVDPDDPSKSVIDPAPGLYLLWGLFPVPFLLIGIVGIVLMTIGRGWLNKPRHRAKRLSRASDSSERDSSVAPRPTPPGPKTDYDKQVDRLISKLDSGMPEPPPIHHGPLPLESENNRKTIVIVLGCFTLFWNGFVFAFLLPQITGGGDVDIFMSLFSIPFILAGLGLLGFTIHQFLSLFNPQIHLQLSDGDLRLGESYSLAWNLTGNADRLTQLVIYLEGRESATYRRGTDTRTERSLFHKQILVDEQRLHFKDGRVALDLPEDSVPTLKGLRNEIQWRLVVSGDIPWWPDLQDAFTVWVRAPKRFEDDTPRRTAP